METWKWGGDSGTWGYVLIHWLGFNSYYDLQVSIAGKSDVFRLVQFYAVLLSLFPLSLYFDVVPEPWV